MPTKKKTVKKKTAKKTAASTGDAATLIWMELDEVKNLLRAVGLMLVAEYYDDPEDAHRQEIAERCAEKATRVLGVKFE